MNRIEAVLQRTPATLKEAKTMKKASNDITDNKQIATSRFLSSALLHQTILANLIGTPKKNDL